MQMNVQTHPFGPVPSQPKPAEDPWAMLGQSLHTGGAAIPNTDRIMGRSQMMLDKLENNELERSTFSIEGASPQILVDKDEDEMLKNAGDETFIREMQKSLQKSEIQAPPLN